MEIKIKNAHQFTPRNLQASAVSRASSSAFAVALTTVRDASTTISADTITPKTPGIKQTDFTNMTRQEMRDWVNDQIRNGKMSLDDSTPFMAMTLKVSAQGSQLVDSATDTARINFMENTRLGIEGALSRNDQEGARQLQVVLDLMQKLQGGTRVDTYA